MTWTPVSQYLYVIITCRISNLVDMLGRRVWHHLADVSRRHSAALDTLHRFTATKYTQQRRPI